MSKRSHNDFENSSEDPRSPNLTVKQDEAGGTVGSSTGSESDDEDERFIVRNQLLGALDMVKYAGTFMAGQTKQCIVDLGLRINRIGDVSLPLIKDDAEAIMIIG